MQLMCAKSGHWRAKDCCKSRVHSCWNVICCLEKYIVVYSTYVHPKNIDPTFSQFMKFIRVPNGKGGQGFYTWIKLYYKMYNTFKYSSLKN